MKLQTLEEYRAEAMAQGVERNHYASKCPMCGTVQSMESLIKAGVSKDEVDNVWSYSCIGRFTGAGSFDKTKDKSGAGCDWTLGGFLRLHNLEVITNDGKSHPRFELATPEEAQLLQSQLARDEFEAGWISK